MPAPSNPLHGRPQSSGGFALVIVLWVLAGLTVIAVVVASSARVSNESVKLLRDRVQAEAAYVSTNARIKIVAASGVPKRMAIESFRGRLLLDGRPTSSAEPGELVSMQDARGLINFNRNNPDQMRALLLRCGAKDGQATELIDALGDYIDRDNDKRLNGAEAFEYRTADLQEPRNAPLLSREEIWRVKGWADLRNQWGSSGCDDLVTVHSDGRFNLNTAPAAVLQSAGLTEDAASAMIEARREGFELIDLPAFTLVGGDPFSRLGGGFAGSVLRVTHRLAAVEWILVYDLELTPSRDGGPWRMHEIRYRPRPKTDAQALAVLPAPDFELPADQRTTPNVLPNSPFAN